MSGSDSDERTVSVRVADSDGNRVTRHFNVDNITYLQWYEHSFTTLTWYLFGVVALAAMAAGYLVSDMTLATVVQDDFTTNLSTAFFFGIPVALAAFRLQNPNRLSIGTVTRDHSYRGDSLQAVEEEFTRASLEYITLGDDLSNAFVNEQYRYQFVPDNIVSVAHEHGETIPIPGILYATGALIAAAGALIDLQYGLFQFGLEAGIGVAVLLAAGALLSEPYRVPDSVRIELQSGDVRTFAMSESDCEELVEAYQRRGD